MFPTKVEGRQPMKLKFAILLLAFTASSGIAFAQSGGAASTPRIDQRQVNQQHRIEQGAKSGALTPKEVARLEKGQQHVQRMEKRAMADGKMTPKERSRIELAQNKQSRKIYNESHDRQRR
jgi:hypothetical protein